MAFTLDKIVPWGRNFDEYVGMFSLNENDLSCRILDCAGGPSSFNCELAKRGVNAVSCDPLYEFSRDEIERRIEETYEEIIRQLDENRDDYVWRDFAGPEEVGKTRMAAMRIFLDDLDRGKRENRYLPHALPELPFKNASFDLALCSHFLFTYSGRLDLKFHYDSIKEMCRVAKEVRIFPVLDIKGTVSEHLTPVSKMLEDNGFLVELLKVDYEFQKGANKVLLIRCRA